MVNIHPYQEDAGGTRSAQRAHRDQAAQPQRGEEQGPELGVLPAVDEDVDAGVEHEQEVGAVRQDLAPAQRI